MSRHIQTYLATCPYCHRPILDLLLDRHILDVHRYLLHPELALKEKREAEEQEAA